MGDLVVQWNLAEISIEVSNLVVSVPDVMQVKLGTHYRWSNNPKASKGTSPACE
jgi:hypothetical protein